MKRTALIVMMAVVLGACSSAEEREAAYQQKAAELQAAGEYEKARLELKNALQIDPKDASSWYHLAEIEEKMQNWRAAAGSYLRVIEIDSNHADAKLRLGRLYLVAGAPERAEPLVREVLAAEPGNAGARVLNAAIHARNDNTEEAERELHAAFAEEPNNIDAAILAASMKSKAGQFDEAAEVLREAIAQHPKHTGLRAVLAVVYGRQDKVEEGAAELKAITTLEPENAAHHVRLAEFYAAKRQPAQAEQVLREALRQRPGEEQLQLALVNFLALRGESDKAVQTLEQFIAQAPADYALRFRLAEFELAMRKPDAARKVYEDIIAAAGTKPEGLRARTQLARLLMAQQDSRRAEELLAQVLTVNSRDNDALSLRAELAFERRDAVAAINDLRAVLRDQPGSAAVLQALARAHALNGERELALEFMGKAAQAAPDDAGVQMALATLLADYGQKDKARQLLKTVLDADPKQLRALETLFKLQLADKKYGEADATAGRIRALQPGLGEYYTGIALQAQGKHSDAIARFEAALKQVPGATEPLTALVKSRVAQKQAPLAEQRLRAELARDAGNGVVQNLLGEVLLIQNKPEAAIAALREATRLMPRVPVPYRNLATAYIAEGDHEAAVAALSDGMSATGHDPSLVLALANYQENRGHADTAIAVYEKALAARPREAVFANNLAMLLVNYRGGEEDLQRAVELSEQLKDSGNPAYLDTLGWAYYRRGDVAAALPVLEAAARAVPDSPLLNYHLGMVYYQNGDHEAARRHLERAVSAKATYRGVDEAKATLEKLATS